MSSSVNSSSAELFEFAETAFDAFDLGGESAGTSAGCGSRWPKAAIGIEHRFGTRRLWAEFGGFRFELLNREPAHEGGIVHEAVLVAAGEIARDRAPAAS
jgi:hypothetical protein